MKITKRLTPYNFTNKNDTGRIKYIVMHYFGGLSTAKNVADYWAGKYVGASAHYTIGHAGEVYQCVGDEDIAWHCGAKSYKHPTCRNSNSIGIEMAVRKKSTKTMNASDQDWYFEAATVAAAAALTKELMEKYKVPEQNVIRHYDVTGKTCPNPYVFNNTENTWDAFKNAIATTTVLPLPPKPQEVPAPVEFIPYKIRIFNCKELNIRPQPNTKQKEVGAIRDNKEYTIVAEMNGWGKLKSGAGWIKLSYTKRS